jgi:hypothetical protein
LAGAVSVSEAGVIAAGPLAAAFCSAEFCWRIWFLSAMRLDGVIVVIA